MVLLCIFISNATHGNYPNIRVQNGYCELAICGSERINYYSTCVVAPLDFNWGVLLSVVDLLVGIGLGVLVYRFCDWFLELVAALVLCAQE